MPALTRRGFALSLGAIVLACTLSSCGSSGSSVPTVTGSFGQTPTITFPSGSPPSNLQVHVLVQGRGPKVQSGTLLVANYLGQIWGGKVFDSSYARKLASAFPIGVGKVIPGWDKTLVGVRAGSRLLLIIPPVDGYGAQGSSSAGITGTDTLAFVVDVIASYSSTAEGQRAVGTMHSTVNGLTVVWPAHSVPTVHVTGTPIIPKTPTVTILSRGRGAPLKPGLVVLQYVVVNPKTGKTVSSTWKIGIPDAEPVGNPSEPSVLDKFLGIPVGSRVLLAVPKSSSGGPYMFAVDIVAQPSLLG